MILLFFLAMTEQCKTLSTSWYRDFKRVSVMCRITLWCDRQEIQLMTVKNSHCVELMPSVYVLKNTF